MSSMLLNLCFVICLMLVVWVASIVKRDASIIDPCWGLGFAIVAWASYWQAESSTSRGLLLATLTTIWSIRLASYLVWRNWGTEEDRRYRAMREKHGKHFIWISLFTVFGLQAVILWIVSWPLQIAIPDMPATPLNWLDFIGGSVWLIGFLFETIGDWQLSRFKAQSNNEGMVMDRGLWRYTRHPNYFGDFCIWWGLYLIATQGGAGWTVVSPLLMSFLLLRVSGVSLLEKDIVERRPAYRRYQQRTNAFFPWLPKQA